ncbi:MAG: Ca2+-binding RTX toxin-like protein [Paracoccaceae bacterium]|jgi:Ca2+-binding RTX toxin-like protein
MVGFPVTLNDGDGFVWDFQSMGGVINGTGNTFDGAFLALDFPNVYNAEAALNNRMYTIEGASWSNPSVALSRNLYVPDDDGWARFVNSATNTSNTATTYTFSIYSDLGFDLNTRIEASSSGDLVADTSDDWFVASNGPTASGPDLGVVIGNGNGGLDPSLLTHSGDDITFEYTVELAAGETASIMFFAVQATNSTTMSDTIALLSADLPEDVLVGLSPEILDSIVNYNLEPSVPAQIIYNGNGLEDFMIGATEDEIFYAESGDDVVLALSGDDIVYAGSGNDVVMGAEGADRLIGEGGQDVLNGDAGDDNISGDSGTSGVLVSGAVPVTETGVDLALTIHAPQAAQGQALNFTGTIGRVAPAAAEANFVYVIDTSASMATTFAGAEAAGDLNGDGRAGDMIDVVIASYSALNDALIAGGYGGADLAIVTFDQTVSVSYTGFVGGAVPTALATLSPSGSSEYESALNQAVTSFGSMGEGANYVFFASDGPPSFAISSPAATTLIDPDGLNATVRAIGLNNNSVIPELDRLDDGIANNSAQLITAPSQLTAALLKGLVESSEIAQLVVTVNGDVVATLMPDDLNASPLGLSFDIEVPDVVLGPDDVVSVRLVASDEAATELLLSFQAVAPEDAAGNDVLSGGAGADMLRGDSGDDVLIGGTDDDHLDGGLGNDDLAGGTGNDSLFGGAGNDILSGGAGADWLNGGPGGRDLVSYAGSEAGVIVDLQAQSASGGHAAGDFLVGFEGIVGSSFSDILTGDALDNTFRPGLGADQIFGGEGFDIIDYSDAEVGVIVNVNHAAGLQKTGSVDKDFLDSIEGIIGSRFEDRLLGTTSDEMFEGGSGDDIIRGKGGSDTMSGGHGNDKLFGDIGTDIMHGGAGNDRLKSLNGDDLLYGDQGDDIITAGGGDDIAYGGSGSDELRGGTGNDFLYGEGGADVLLGGNNSDWLEGGAGNDRLKGDSGGDTLIGGAGDDILYGGDAGDTFIFADDFGFDQLRDFQDGIDILDFSALPLGTFENLLSYASDRSSGLRIEFDNGDGVFISSFFLANFDASDVIL